MRPRREKTRSDHRAMWLRAGLRRLSFLALLCVVHGSRVEAGDLRDFISDLHGGDGVDLTSAIGSQNFSTASQSGLDDLSSSIASGVGFFSLNSAVYGYTFDFATGVPVRTTESLGPLVAERADTLGAGKLNVSLSYTRLDFKRFQGDSLSDLSVTVPGRDIWGVDGEPDGVLGFPLPEDECDSNCLFTALELDQVRFNLDVEIEQDVYAFLAKYGISPHWDAGIIVPLVHSRVRASSQAEILRNELVPGLSESFHNIAPADMSSTTGGSATGLGDITLRTKYNFLRKRERWPDLALLGQLKLATGDEDDLLGTGETNFLGMLVASKDFGRISPHLNIGYEMTTGPSELDNLRYIAGIEAGVHPRLTLTLDVVGRWEPHGDGIGDHLVDLATGAKVEIVRSLVFGTVLRFPLNRNEGLRTDVTWTVGFEYTFGRD